MAPRMLWSALAIACSSFASGQTVLFEEAQALTTLVAAERGDPYPCIQEGGSCLIGYAPDGVVAHDAQKLSIYLPPNSSPPLQGYPVIMYFPAGAFLEVPEPENNEVFLRHALDRGWAVVTVGTVGIDSTPVPGQPDRCCQGGPCIPDEVPNNTTACRDYNMYYPPNTSEWDDFDIFYGEKDGVWARQFIAMNATTYTLDNSRVFVAGSSSGAHYAAFLALHENLAWGEFNPMSPEQTTYDTTVDGLLMFEPVSWFEGPFAESKVGLGRHWPKLDTSNQEANQFQRAETPGEVGTSVLAASSSSTWARSSASIPVFIASGNGDDTALTRNANIALFSDDYCRASGSTPCPSFDPLQTWTADPLIDFSFTDEPGEGEFEFNLHSSLHAILLRQDLLGNDPTYHTEHSRLYLREDTLWGFIPDDYNKDGPGTITTWQEIDYFVSGEYCDSCFWDDACVGESPGLCGSIANERLVITAMDWVWTEGCGAAGVAFRNAGTNPAIYTVEPRMVGQTIHFTVDMSSGVAADYDFASIFGFDSQVTIGSGRVLLAYDLGGNGELLNTDPQVLEKDTGSGLATVTIDVPSELTLCGFVVYSQAVIYKPGLPYVLTNAQDMTVGL